MRGVNTLVMGMVSLTKVTAQTKSINFKSHEHPNDEVRLCRERNM